MAGIKEVAKKAGVSIATVSNVVNNTKPVSPSLQARVHAAIAELQYEVNLVGRGLKSNKTNQIGVIVPSFHEVFFPAILQGINDAAQKTGYTISVFETNGNIETEKAHVASLQNSWIDGIILASYANQENISDREYIRSLAKNKTGKKSIPVVTLEITLDPSLDAVIYDNRRAAGLAMSHLISMGHKQVAHIAAPLRFQIGQHRLEGCRDTLLQAGLDLPFQLICEGDYTTMGGYRCMEELLKSGESFTAVFCASDQMAIGAMRAILDAGKRIPEDIAVVGVDNTFPSTLVSPSLSSVNLPKYEMGQEAMNLLSKRIVDPERPVEVTTLDTNLVIRKSTSQDGDDSWELTRW